MTHILGVQGPAVNIPAGASGGSDTDDLQLLPYLGTNTGAQSLTFTCPGGTETDVYSTNRGGQTWLDSTGHFTEPGLYVSWLTLIIPAGASGYGMAFGEFLVSNPLDLASLSAIQAALGGDIYLPGPDLVSLTAGDLAAGHRARWRVQLSSGATTILAQMTVQRLLAPISSP